MTKRQIEAGANLSIKECLNMDYTIAMHYCEDKTSDLYEGVRALIVDKDNKPKWNPSTIEDVTDKRVNFFFSKLPSNIAWNIPV